MRYTDKELLELIMKYSTRMMEQKSIDELILFIAEFAREVVDSDRCSIWLIDYKKHILWTKVAQGVEKLKHLEVPINSGVVGYALANKKDIILNDPYSSNIFYPDIDKLTGYKTNCILAVPIKNSEEEIIGIAQVINKRESKLQHFDEEDIKYLKIAVSYLSGALNILMLQEKNREKDKILFQQSKMAEMGGMMASIIHQWKQPLNIINLQNQKMDFFVNLGKLNTEELKTISVNVDKQVKYINQTMNVFRDFFKPSKSKVKFKIDDIFKDIIIIIEKLYSSQGVFLDIKSCEEFIYGYPNELKQVLINILNNSRDAILENKSNHKTIYMTSVIEKDRLKITINDFAGGIPEDIIDKIFEPYFTTKDSNNGTGIGLDMSKEIIKKSGGNISVKNIKNKDNEVGACFNIDLPL
jgi:signal transduction histidine kinase